METVKNTTDADELFDSELESAVTLFSQLSDEAKDEIIDLLKCLLHIDN